MIADVKKSPKLTTHWHPHLLRSFFREEGYKMRQVHIYRMNTAFPTSACEII